MHLSKGVGLGSREALVELISELVEGRHVEHLPFPVMLVMEVDVRVQVRHIHHSVEGHDPIVHDVVNTSWLNRLFGDLWNQVSVDIVSPPCLG